MKIMPDKTMSHPSDNSTAYPMLSPEEREQLLKEFPAPPDDGLETYPGSRISENERLSVNKEIKELKAKRAALSDELEKVNSRLDHLAGIYGVNTDS